MSKFVTPTEAIELSLLGNDDYLQRGKGRMLKWSKYVYDDLNLQVIKKAVRQEFYINRRTRTVDLPCNENDLCSVSVVDRNGVIWPCFLNDRIHNDLVQIPADKDCNCEWHCGYQLCNLIKGYEAVTEVKTDTLPDGTPVSFTCINRRAVDRNGFLYIENQYPIHVFTNGVWTDTVLQTDHIKKCKLECNDKGCVCDSEANVNAVCESCGINPNTIPIGGTASIPPQPRENEWIYHCMSKFEFLHVQFGCHPFMRDPYRNIYNINELGNRLLFPADFPFEKVLIRYYDVPSLKTIEIPFIAVPTFVTGLKWFDCRWNDNKQQLEAKYGQDYSTQKWGLFSIQNKYTLAEWATMLFPFRKMPGFIPPRHHLDDRY